MEKLTQVIEWFSSALVVVLIVMVMSSCSSNYQFGDISKVYCHSLNKELRAQIKVTMKNKGFEFGVDYCAAHGLVDVLVN